jgi:hypothetical protein
MRANGVASAAFVLFGTRTDGRGKPDISSNPVSNT